MNAFKIGHKANMRSYVDDEQSYHLLKKVLLEGCEESRKALVFLDKYYEETLRGFIKKDDPTALNAKFYREIVNDRNTKRRDLLNDQASSIFSTEELQNDNNYDDDLHEHLNEEFLNRNKDLNHEDVLIAILDYTISDKSEE